MLVGGTPVVPLVTHGVLHVVIHHERPAEGLNWTRDHGVHVRINVRRKIWDLRLVGSGKRAWAKRAHLRKAIEHGSIGKNEELSVVGRTRRTSKRQGQVKVRSQGHVGHVSLHGIELGSQTLVRKVHTTERIGDRRSRRQIALPTIQRWSLRVSNNDGRTRVLGNLTRLVGGLADRLGRVSRTSWLLGLRTHS